MGVPFARSTIVVDLFAEICFVFTVIGMVGVAMAAQASSRWKRHVAEILSRNGKKVAIN